MVKNREIFLLLCLIITVVLSWNFGVDALGFSASVISFLLFLPQAAMVWKVRQDRAALSVISLSTQLFILANASIWGIYGYQTEAFWVAAPGLVNGPLALTVSVLILKSRSFSQSSHAEKELT